SNFDTFDEEQMCITNLPPVDGASWLRLDQIEIGRPSVRQFRDAAVIAKRWRRSVSFDDNPEVHLGVGGAYVNAWVWINDADARRPIRRPYKSRKRSRHK